MNGLRLPDDMLWGSNTGDQFTNIMTLRSSITRTMLDRVRTHIDAIYDAQTKEKQAEINKRAPKLKTPATASLSIFYKGVELPIVDKTKMTLDGIDYVPVFQIVDSPVHSQKNGKFIIVKTNMRNAFIKMSGTSAYVLTKNSTIPLFVYLFYLSRDIDQLCEILHLEQCHESEAAYAVPDVFGPEDDRFVYIRPYEHGYWKDYLLIPFALEFYNQHVAVLQTIREAMRLSTEQFADSCPSKNSDTDVDVDDIPDEPTLTETIKVVYDGDVAITIIPQEQHGYDETLPIVKYHEAFARAKCTVSKSYISALFSKLVARDMTLGYRSVMDFIVESISNDHPLPIGTDIGDLNQKMLRFMEWYPMKISNVQSYPEQGMIMEVAKVEQRLVYDNNINPLAELAMMSRANLFGKGGLPRESCQTAVRNIHPSYFGVIDPIDSPSGMSVGISLHLVPELHSLNFQREIAERSRVRKFAR